MATGLLQAKALGMLHNQSVELVKYPLVSGQSLCKKRLNLIIGGIGRNHPDAGKNSSGIRIHNKNRLACRVKEDAVGGLGPDAAKIQKFLPQRSRRFAKKFF